jgi:hypothetical protein
MPVKTVDVQDFQRQGSRYLRGEHAVAVAQDGHTIGIYIPVPQAQDASFLAALERLEASVARVLAETGMTEDELADLLDLSRPFPLAQSEATGTHVADR